jgi:polysaccharide deacetylase family protein (PEP-CTERM system associated)
VSVPATQRRSLATSEFEPRLLELAVAPGKPRAPAAFTVDVEDWYQSCVDYDAPITERVVRNVHRIVEILDEFRVKATFFVQGRVAETFPKLLQELVEEGHEVQSHGHTHRPLSGMNRIELRAELERARHTVEDAAGVSVTAFRAQDFSIGAENLWALDVLAEVGFTVDSSIFPIRTPRYGIAGWPLGPHEVALPGGGQILEVPVAVWKTGPWRIPVAGGGYFRFAPAGLLTRALRSIAAVRPAVVYCHPYEFNATELEDYRGAASARLLYSQGLGRDSFVRRIRQLLTALPFGRFDEALLAWDVT